MIFFLCCYFFKILPYQCCTLLNYCNFHSFDSLQCCIVIIIQIKLIAVVVVVVVVKAFLFVKYTLGEMKIRKRAFVFHGNDLTLA